jgi:predicted CXXCH cytochrome family protein
MRSILIIGLLAIMAVDAGAQLKRDRSKECVICHISWGDGYEKLNVTLQPEAHPKEIDGQEARVAGERMCWSCHDAYVSDSRRYFIEEDAHAHMTEMDEATRNSDLPLDANGKVYCGTCHTPHATHMERQYAFSPFVRQDHVQSTLCLNCHADHALEGQSHPIHVELDGALPFALAGNSASTTTVECLTCHQMHSASSQKLTRGHDRTELCKSCHENQFNLVASDHDLRVEHGNWQIPGQEFTAGNADACASCHVTHAASGPALSPVASTDGASGLCITCHSTDGVAAEKAWLDHGHPVDEVLTEVVDYRLPLESGKMNCLTCHDPHRWSMAAGVTHGKGNEEGNALDSFLRLPDDENSQLCTACHRDQSEALLSDHNASSWENPGKTQCTSCHLTHEAEAFTDGHANREASAFTSLCLSCHEGSGDHGATRLGEHGHPILVEQKPEWALPAITAKALETLSASEQAPGQALLVGCESCHDPHRWSAAGHVWSREERDGNDGSSFLLMDNRNAGLCRSCHQDQAAVLQTGHDMRTAEAGTSACSNCHSTHGAQGAWALLSTSLNDAELGQLTSGFDHESHEANPANWSAGARHCLSCHSSSGASVVHPAAWAHPQDVMTVAGEGRQDGSRMPVYTADGQSAMVGRVDCTSCHDPHHAHVDDSADGAETFLRQASTETSCADCHQEKALWKYRYYHNPDKRVQP